MPVFIASLWGAALNIAGTLVGRVMIALGISALTYTGLSASIDWLRDNAVTQLNLLPAQVLGVLTVMKVGSAMSVIISATVVRLTLSGMSGTGSLKVWKK